MALHIDSAATAVAAVDATDEPELAAEKKEKNKGKKKASPQTTPRRTKQHDKPQLQGDDEEDGEADGSHPRPDHATVQWLLWNEFAVSPEVAAAALNVSRNSGYAAIHKKHIPATRVGNRLMVPTAYLRQRLYLEPPPQGDKPALQIALQPKKQEQIKSPKQRRHRR